LAEISKVSPVEVKQKRQLSPGLVLLFVVGYSLIGLLWLVDGTVAVSHHRSPLLAWVFGPCFLLLGVFWAVRFCRSSRADRTNGPSDSPEP
jgi:hypothetical protein